MKTYSSFDIFDENGEIVKKRVNIFDDNFTSQFGLLSESRNF